MLKADTRFELSILHHGKGSDADDILAITAGVPVVENTAGADFVLQICQPGSCRKYPQPSGLLGYADTSDIPENWVEAMRRADCIFAPNTSNYEIYRRYFDKVYLTLPGIATQPFATRKNYRKEGSAQFSFITIGSFSFRKGVDILLEAFLTEFKPEEAHLHFHLQDHQIDAAINMICKLSVQHGTPPNITVTSNKMSEEWISRWYNRSDCYITATRGEGWGLPIHEAMLCALPVIAPFSTAMKDYLNEEVAYLVPAQIQQVSEIENPFGFNFKNSYGQGTIAYWEPQVKDLRAQMRHVWLNRDEAEQRGKAGQAHMLRQFNEQGFGQRVGDAIIAFMESRAAQAVS